jgi:UDP-N-acetylmuramate: L-alanyl-gamma-D-glutamyl-meso-diaminopimelate ligase
MHTKKQRVHFIAIGGSVMHNLAIALKEAGHDVSGSDDEIFEPSRSTLTKHGLLPEKEGWFPELITSSLDVVVLGMHARKDNPELLKAQQLGLKILSFPEYIYEQSRDKQRIVISGSHGKTTTTAIIIHVLNYFKRKFDYIIGAKVPGIEYTVRLSNAPQVPTSHRCYYRHSVGSRKCIPFGRRVCTPVRSVCRPDSERRNSDILRAGFHGADDR